MGPCLQCVLLGAAVQILSWSTQLGACGLAAVATDSSLPSMRSEGMIKQMTKYIPQQLAEEIYAASQGSLRNPVDTMDERY